MNVQENLAGEILSKHFPILAQAQDRDQVRIVLEDSIRSLEQKYPNALDPAKSLRSDFLLGPFLAKKQALAKVVDTNKPQSRGIAAGRQAAKDCLKGPERSCVSGS